MLRAFPTSNREIYVYASPENEAKVEEDHHDHNYATRERTVDNMESYQDVCQDIKEELVVVSYVTCETEDHNSEEQEADDLEYACNVIKQEAVNMKYERVDDEEEVDEKIVPDYEPTETDFACPDGNNEMIVFNRAPRQDDNEKIVIEFIDIEGFNAASLQNPVKEVIPTKTKTRKRPPKNTDLQCPYCDSHFSRPHLLDKHIKAHLGEKPYSCDVCEYKCTQASNLKVHKLTHTKEKPFACMYCAHRSLTSANMKAHERTHTKEKPYSCKYCDYKCYASSYLSAHMKKHSNVKPYSCEFCPFRTSRSWSVKQHRKLHFRDTPYKPARRSGKK